MSKLSLLVLIFLLVNNCSINKKKGFWGKEKSNIKETETVKIILTKQTIEEQEFNPTLKIKVNNSNLFTKVSI